MAATEVCISQLARTADGDTLGCRTLPWCHFDFVICLLTSTSSPTRILHHTPPNSLKMVLTMKALPLPEKRTELPVYITKVVSVNKICFRFVSNMDEYVFMIKGMQRYYADKTVKCYIDAVSGSEEAIKDRLFILKREGIYHRVKVNHIWPNNTYIVHLLDEGFDCLANEKQLILNDFSELMNKPSHSFVFPLDMGRSYDTKLNYLINYGLQKVVNSKSNFFASVSSDNQVTLFYRDHQGLVSINDYLVQFLQRTQQAGSDRMKESIDAHLEPVVNNEKQAPGLNTKHQGLFSTNVPRFELPEGDLNMKCKHVFNASDFYLKLKKTSEFVKFINELNEHHIKFPSKTASPVEINRLYITNYKDKWTRLLILGLVSQNYYSCLLFDKGIVGTISDEDIYELDEHFKKMPPRSVKSCLAFVKPTGEKWTREANEFFKSQIKSCQLCVYPINYGPDGIFYCSLIKGDENISDSLHQRGYALIDI